jgi:hypothetical protein
MTNNNTTSYNIVPKHFLNYINYELSFFEKITTNKKFFFNSLSNDIFELNVYETKEDGNDDNNNNNKSKYHLIYRANNLYRFIKNLFMIRDINQNRKKKIYWLK